MVARVQLMRVKRVAGEGKRGPYEFYVCQGFDVDDAESDMLELVADGPVGQRMQASLGKTLKVSIRYGRNGKLYVREVAE